MNQPLFRRPCRRPFSLDPLFFSLKTVCTVLLSLGVWTCMSTSVFAQLPSVQPLSSLTWPDGINFIGQGAESQTGYAVSRIGDVNGDGIEDCAITAKDAGLTNSTLTGLTYVIFGGFNSSATLTGLNGTNGFTTTGVTVASFSGYDVSDIGDINGDGFEDFMVSAIHEAPQGRTKAGATYVVYGRLGAFPPTISLGNMGGVDGFEIHGERSGDESGKSITDLGDVNGDFIPDMLIGAWAADKNGSRSGSSYLIFGKNTDFNDTLDLDTLGKSTGIEFIGGAPREASGWAVSEAGDFNRDGHNDFLIGAPDPTFDPLDQAGKVYLIYGPVNQMTNPTRLDTMSKSIVQVFLGIEDDDETGYSVSDAGDVNHDGYPDILIGAPNADPNGLENAGRVYLVFGSPYPLPNPLDLSTLDGGDGYIINGIIPGGRLGWDVNEAGDVNNDGRADFMMSAPLAGYTYLIYGKAGGYGPTFDLSQMNANTGLVISGFTSSSRSGNSVSGAGDLNNDGFDDLILGSNFYSTSNMNVRNGAAHILFGDAANFPVEWLSFEVNPTSFRQTEIAWSTSSEIQNNYFVVERSADGYQFEVVGEVFSQGDSETPQAYTFTDREALIGVNHYRLRQVDLDGAYTYSTIRTTYHTRQGESIIMMPNPAHDYLTIKGLNPQAPYSWQILTRVGQTVANGTFESYNGQATLDLNAFNVSTGMYFVHLRNEAGEQSRLPLMVK